MKGTASYGCAEPRRHRNRLGGVLLPLGTCLFLLAGLPGSAGRAQQVLHVGVVDGSPPCSFREAGVWSGVAVELWNRIASREQLPYVLLERPSVQELLEATRTNKLDVAVGCINVSPERLPRYRFTLPFQEDGLAVMVVNSRLDLGRAFLGSLLTPTLLQLLGGFLLAIALLALLTWKVENYPHLPLTLSIGRRRSFSKVFQVLATGPGGNTIVNSSRGDLIVIVAYLVRIVSASLLVGYLTVNVAREIQGRASGRITSPEDLRGLRVGVRSGTVSESLLRELNGEAGEARVAIVPMDSIGKAVELLITRRADAVLGDNLQLSYLLGQTEAKGLPPTLALQGIRPESQAFALSPALPATTAEHIDLAISALKRNGVVTGLRQKATEPRTALPR